MSLFDNYITLYTGKRRGVCARCLLQFDTNGDAITPSALVPKELRCRHMRAGAKIYVAFEDYDYEGGRVRSVHETRKGAREFIARDRLKRKKDKVPAADGYHIEEYTLND